MTQKSELGQLGENIACEYLAEKGYKIIERNFRRPWGEIDAVAQYQDGTLVFVEVKTMTGDSTGLQPEDQITKSKLTKLQKSAQLYTGHYPGKVKDTKGWRIDLLAISIQGEERVIRHYENI